MSAPTEHPTARTIQCLDTLNRCVGQLLAWLTLAMVVLVATVVLMRTLVGVGSIALQESITYLHATVLMLCLGYNLQQSAHVRVDVFYARFNSVQKAWVDALGSILFLLPFSLFLTWISLPFAINAWKIHETSADPGGLPLVFLLKTLIPVSGLLLSAQALSETLRALYTLTYTHQSIDRD